MGVGGSFWELLKPYARPEGFDYIRNKRVAVDLSFWIVQQETATKANVRNPHLRLTFFRTINLFSKFGAFPVFVVDGTPSPLKSQARIARFFRGSGIDLSGLPVVEEGVSVERNAEFSRRVQECVELLELLGIPVLKAREEAEALCAQLNSEGHVDACITADSDAFLFGAKCVIKCLRPNCKEPLECYHMSDIESGLGLKRKHLIAISLLVGNDYDLNGVQGIGLDTAVRFVQGFSEDEILNRLQEKGNGATVFDGAVKSMDDSIPCLDEKSPRPKVPHCSTFPRKGCLEKPEGFACDCSTSDADHKEKEQKKQEMDDSIPSLDERSPRPKVPHCSICGHPGRKKSHLKFSCDFCGTFPRRGCLEKPEGFVCDCSTCDMDRKEKAQKKQENWQLRVCKKIAMEQNFPNNEIIELYLSNNHGHFTEKDGPHISWESPKTEVLVDFLAYHQHWEPSYIRQRMLPMLSTIFFREKALNPTNTLLYGQYEFDSIQRVKVRFGHQFFVVKWKKAVHAMASVAYTIPGDSDIEQEKLTEVDESIDLLDECNVPQIHVDDGCWFLLTDENMDLVRAAFPEEVNRFLLEKELKESKRRNKSGLRSEGVEEMPDSPKSKGVQLSITEFYRSAKVIFHEKPEDSAGNSDAQGRETSTEKRKASDSKLSKSVRRRLLFG
ncbi:flap endonuclease GEN-like 1 [Vitis vinifera]|uniref:Flap endonuclease GEN-like 1 n=1 Tax=Vitis vinifera TaxID=29760 RepID=D7U7R5_VITVI|eukprot:XP_002273159.1 PREDICTED: flap endonuclease GEN-like 1 [Vitis vinifera]